MGRRGKEVGILVRYKVGNEWRTRRVYSAPFEGWKDCGCIYDRKLHDSYRGHRRVDGTHYSRVALGLLSDVGIDHELIKDEEVYWSINNGVARWFENGKLVHEEIRY